MGTKPFQNFSVRWGLCRRSRKGRERTGNKKEEVREERERREGEG